MIENMKNLYSSKPVSAAIKPNWNILLQGVQYTVHLVYEKRLFGFLKWHETSMVAGPYNSRREAKRAVSEVYKKFNIKPSFYKPYDTK